MATKIEKNDMITGKHLFCLLVSSFEKIKVSTYSVSVGTSLNLKQIQTEIKVFKLFTFDFKIKTLFQFETLFQTVSEKQFLCLF